MLKRSFRLKKREIDRVYKKGHRVFEDFLLVRSLPNAAKHSRFAVIIPKSTSPKSVSRSRLKRKAMVALQENISLLKNNHDIILSFKKVPAENKIEPTLKHILETIK